MHRVEASGNAGQYRVETLCGYGAVWLARNFAKVEVVSSNLIIRSMANGPESKALLCKSKLIGAIPIFASNEKGSAIMNPEDYEEQNVGGKQFKRKNTKKWCKGKKGREHKPVTELDIKTWGWLFAKNPDLKCGDRRMRLNPFHFWCYHHVVCSVCGKELRYSPEICPTNNEKTGW